MSILSWALILGALFFGAQKQAEVVPVPPSTPVPETPTPLALTETVESLETSPLPFEEEQPVAVPVVEAVTPPTPPVTPAVPEPSIDTQTKEPAEEPAGPPERPGTGSNVARNVQAALVNIICTSDNPIIRPMSGSGVFIDDKGIILTVAHIGQYFLLAEGENTPVSCVVRTGAPARATYHARALYISESWITENPSILLEQQATGTGEHDFALLTVTKSATNTPLPPRFPALPVSHIDTDIGSSIIIGSYGAQFISSADVVSSLYPTLIEDTVKDVYTFKRTSVDVLSLGGNIAAQLGSSGGAVSDNNGSLVGLITTSTVEGPIQDRDVRAITPLHIRTSFAADTKADLDSFLKAADVEALRVSFLGDMEELRETLLEVLGI